MTVAVSLSPTPILQFFNNLGAPNANGTLLTQVGSVNYPTYQDSAGLTPLPNPIPLNSRGEVSNAAGISCQLFLAANVTYTFTLFDAGNNQIDQAQSVTAPASNQVLSEWITEPAPTFISATSFSVPGNLTNVFDANRRTKTTNAGGTIYSTVSSSAFAAGITTVTVVNDSGVLDSGLSAVSVGILDLNNPSIKLPWPVSQGGTGATTGVGALDDLMSVGTSAPSASTLVLTGTTGDMIDVTGTTGVTAITMNVGSVRWTRFTGIVMITAGGALVPPGGGNYTTQAGDIICWRCYSGPIVRAVTALKADGSPILAGLGTDTCGRFSVLGGSTPFSGVHYCPYNGNRVPIQGVYYTIPTGVQTVSGGVQSTNFSSCSIDKATGQTLANSTRYYVYLYNSAGTLTIDFSTTGYALDTTYGTWVKSSDSSCLLIGQVWINGTKTIDGSANKQNAISRYNPVMVPLYVTVSTPGFTNTSYAENNSANILEWVQWSDNTLAVQASCNAFNNTNAATVSFGIGIDSTTAITGHDCTVQMAAANQILEGTAATATSVAAEGHHVAHFLVKCSSNTGQINAGIMYTSYPVPS
jgi:hypothetical protein